jgi:hypothetical protein
MGSDFCIRQRPRKHEYFVDVAGEQETLVIF